MSALAIWMDTTKAKIFRFTVHGVTKRRVQDEGPQHPKETLGKNHPYQQTDQERFYRQLSKDLMSDSSDSWLLMGPGLAKDHFLDHLRRYHPELSKRIVGVHRIDERPDSQLQSYSHDFFRRFNLFNLDKESVWDSPTSTEI